MKRIWWAMVVGLGCSTTNNTIVSPTCGAGTVLVDGVCVAADAAVTDTSSSSDVGGDGAAPDTATASGDAPAEVAGDAGGADPCPTKPAALDCSGMCGGAKGACDDRTCWKGGDLAYAQLKAPGPWIVRTPDKPGTNPKCARCGPKVVSTVMVAVDTSTLSFPLNRVRFSVAPPWHLGFSNSGCPELPEQCKVAEGVVVYTDDPNAPARNVTIDLIKFGEGCP